MRALCGTRWAGWCGPLRSAAGGGPLAEPGDGATRRIVILAMSVGPLMAACGDGGAGGVTTTLGDPPMAGLLRQSQVVHTRCVCRWHPLRPRQRGRQGDLRQLRRAGGCSWCRTIIQIRRMRAGTLLARHGAPPTTGPRSAFDPVLGRQCRWRSGWNRSAPVSTMATAGSTLSPPPRRSFAEPRARGMWSRLACR
jgi:hypothetical protein